MLFKMIIKIKTIELKTIIKGFLLFKGSFISLTFSLLTNLVNSPPLVAIKDLHPFSGK